MKIVCLGAMSANEATDLANRSYVRTSDTSQKILNYYESQGGNTPLKKKAPADEPGLFDKAWGIFKKLGTIASTDPKPAHIVKTPGPPIAAMAGIGIVALILLKAVK